MKKSTFTNRIVSFMKSKLLSGFLVALMTIFFVHQFFLLIQLRLQFPFPIFRAYISLFILAATGWVIHRLLLMLHSKNELAAELDEPLDNYLSCSLQIGTLEEKLRLKDQQIIRLSKQGSKLTNTYLALLTKTVFLKKEHKRSQEENESEVQNRIKSIETQYEVEFKCHKCGLSVSSFDDVKHHSEFCTMQIL